MAIAPMLKYLHRLSIRHHIVGHYTLTLAIILGLSGAVIFSFVYKNMRNNTIEKLSFATSSITDIVKQAAKLSVRNHLQTITKTNIDILTGLEQKVKIGQISRQEAMAKGAEILLQQHIGAHGYFYVLSSKGVVLVHPVVELINKDISNYEFVQQQISRKDGYLEYDWKNPGEKQSRPKALNMAYFEPWDWIISASSYREEFNFLADDLRLGLQSQRFGKTGYAFVINGQGDFILHPWLKGNVFKFGNPPVESLVKKIITMKKGEFSYDWQDHGEDAFKKKIVFFDYIPELDWIVGSTVYEDEIFQPIKELSKIIFLIICCSLALTIPLGFFLSALITRPLSKLTQQMDQSTGEDDLGVSADENALGEIGILGQHFNHYIERLRRANKKILSEIYDRIQAEQQLTIFRNAFESAVEGIYVTDPSGNILVANRASSRITDYPPEELIGKNTRIFKSEKHDKAFYSELWGALLKTGCWTGEIWNRRKGGEIFLETLSISAIFDEDKKITHYVAVFHDITDTKQQEEQIKHQAFHDALTGLPNRILANDRITVSLAHVKRGGTQLAVLFLDLDNFKNVNDTLGHEMGDQLLLQVANRLVSVVREEDTVARLGGDEFLVLVAAITTEKIVIEIVQRLLKTLADPFNLGDSQWFVTASIGVAFYPQDGDSAGVLTKNADIAMYQAKTTGKNNYHLFTSDLSDRINYLQQLENNLRQAITNKEFTVFYQPKIDPTMGRIVGAEALVRWRQHDGTFISPDDFIPLAEETGLIIPLGEQVLDLACRAIRKFNRLGYTNLSVAVNLSPHQFSQVNLVERIIAILQKHEVPYSQLELEITETTIMTNIVKTVETLNQLVMAGIKISIDDFGTGYSSLYYLKRFPIDTLKIDRSFIRDMTSDPSDALLVETIILMAHNLGINVVAEGVETKEQLDQLINYDCDQIQGYYYSKPLPMEAFLTYLNEQGAYRNGSPLKSPGASDEKGV